MTRRSKFWWVVAGLFIFVNFAGGVFAALRGEVLHAGIHAGLLLLAAYPVWRLASSWRRGESAIPAPPRELTDRLTHLEQSIDAIAIEVERIGEGQRFMTGLFTEKATRRTPSESAAEPIEVKARETEG